MISTDFKNWGEYGLPTNCQKVLDVWIRGFNIKWKVKDEKLFIEKESEWNLLSRRIHGSFDNKISMRCLIGS